MGEGAIKEAKAHKRPQRQRGRRSRRRRRRSGIIINITSEECKEHDKKPLRIAGLL